MLGEEKRSVSHKTVVGDADSLIALAHKDDDNHAKAKKIGAWLISKGYEVILS